MSGRRLSNSQFRWKRITVDSRLSWSVAVLILLAAMNGCYKTEYAWRSTRPQMAFAGGTPKQDQSLFVRLGGKPKIEAVVDNFVSRVVGDLRINSRFATADIPHLKAMLVDQICQASGGPCTYEGRDMKLTHAGLAIGGEEFDALVADLVSTMDSLEIGRREQMELLNTLRPMRSDIVEKPVTAKP
jgi:hemoglobin